MFGMYFQKRPIFLLTRAQCCKLPFEYHGTVQMTRILNRPPFIDDNQLSCPRYYVNEWKIDLIAKSTLILLR